MLSELKKIDENNALLSTLALCGVPDPYSGLDCF
jgi:hypothetical protein